MPANKPRVASSCAIPKRYGIAPVGAWIPIMIGERSCKAAIEWRPSGHCGRVSCAYPRIGRYTPTPWGPSIDRHAGRAWSREHSGPDCAAARWCSGDWCTSPVRGGSCRVWSTSRTSTGRNVQQLATLAPPDRPARSSWSSPGTTATVVSSASAPPSSRSSRCSCCSAAGRSGTTSAPAKPGRMQPRRQARLNRTRRRHQGCTAVGRRAAVREPQRRAEGRLLRRRHPRRHPHPALEGQRAQGDLAHLCRAVSRHEVDHEGRSPTARRDEILEGGVQRAGDRVRINVQLIDAATDAHLWAESYDRELTAANIFAIQSEVAAAIAGALKAALTRETGTGRGGPDTESRSLGGLPARQAAHGQAHERRRLPTPSSSSARRSISTRSSRSRMSAWPTRFCCRSTTAARPREPPSHEARRRVAEALELDPDLAEAGPHRQAVARHRATRACRSRCSVGRSSSTPTTHQRTIGSACVLTASADGRGAGAVRSAPWQLDPLSAIINNLAGRTCFRRSGASTKQLVRYRQGDRDRSVDSRCAYVHLGDLRPMRSDRFDRRGALIAKRSVSSTRAIPTAPRAGAAVLRSR